MSQRLVAEQAGRDFHQDDRVLTRSQPLRHSRRTWTQRWRPGHGSSPRKLGPQWALDELEADLGQHDEHDNPGDIPDPRVAERVEYRDLSQDIP